MRNRRFCITVVTIALLGAAHSRTVFGQDVAATSKKEDKAAVVPHDYVIGPEDVVGVVFSREPEMSGDVTVRPDGKITLPLIGEIAAAGLKPDY